MSIEELEEKITAFEDLVSISASAVKLDNTNILVFVSNSLFLLLQSLEYTYSLAYRRYSYLFVMF